MNVEFLRKQQQYSQKEGLLEADFDQPLEVLSTHWATNRKKNIDLFREENYSQQVLPHILSMKPFLATDHLRPLKVFVDISTKRR